VVVGTDFDALTGDPVTTLLGCCALHEAAVAQWSSMPGHPAVVAEVSALPTILEALWDDGTTPWTMERVTA
jgi:hypothetical protein